MSVRNKRDDRSEEEEGVMKKQETRVAELEEQPEVVMKS